MKKVLNCELNGTHHKHRSAIPHGYFVKTRPSLAQHVPSLLPLVFTLTQPQPTHAPVSHASEGAVPSSVWLKPQSRQMDDTQRFMSSSDSATRYQVRSSVFRSKTKVPSSSFLVKDRPASTSRARQRDKMVVQLFGKWN